MVNPLQSTDLEFSTLKCRSRDHVNKIYTVLVLILIKQVSKQYLTSKI